MIVIKTGRDSIAPFIQDILKFTATPEWMEFFAIYFGKSHDVEFSIQAANSSMEMLCDAIEMNYEYPAITKTWDVQEIEVTVGTSYIKISIDTSDFWNCSIEFTEETAVLRHALKVSTPHRATNGRSNRGKKRFLPVEGKKEETENENTYENKKGSNQFKITFKDFSTTEVWADELISVFEQMRQDRAPEMLISDFITENIEMVHIYDPEKGWVKC